MTDEQNDEIKMRDEIKAYKAFETVRYCASALRRLIAEVEPIDTVAAIHVVKAFQLMDKLVRKMAERATK